MTASPQGRQVRSGAIVLAVAAVGIAAVAGMQPIKAPAAATPGQNWTDYGGPDAQHYSPLDQINRANVSQLGMIWSLDLDDGPNAMSVPLAVDGVVYFTTGYSLIHAVDARTGKELWRYDPKAPEAAGHKMRAAWGSRGIAYARGKIFTGTIDGRLVAVDAKTGALAWEKQTLSKTDESYISGPPWIAGDKVVIGFGGGDFGPVRGYVTAYDIATGDKAWRFYTVPGDPAKGPDGEASDDVMAMAAKTWTGDFWKYGGGGTVWHAMAYDAKRELLFFGTGNGAPWNRKIRSPGGGDTLFVCSIIAVDAKTGKYRWHYQVNPGESWDYNSAMDIELATLDIGGKPRDVVMHAPKNGFYYVIDRDTGKLISAENFAPVNWATGIDLKTGRPNETPWARFPDGKPVVLWPSPVGAHAAEAMAYSPRTQLTYIPAYDQKRVYVDPPSLKDFSFKPGQVINNGIGTPPPTMIPPAGTSELLAWDPVRQKKVWSVPQVGQRTGSVTATGGDLVFQGQADGMLQAFDARTGKSLWRFDTQNGVQAQPITYLLDGKQYVTVMASWRAMGASGRVPEYDYYTTRRRVITFALGGAAKLPPVAPVTPVANDPTFKVDPALADAGKPIFGAHCAICHGPATMSGGAAPDLKRAGAPLSFDAIKAVLHDGLLVPRGMPRFAEFSDAEIASIQHYIRQQARAALAAQTSDAARAKLAQEARKLHVDQ
ncbi:PQQ-dependent dehydrogenase, methanol/ethanol family [Sphingomonas montanisoli]|uniref:PQQ-dependent dehydrogenase, methanol/ethanol family n=1 Tax=Sphingomonas montanisoli TaxID=2606412 RepID=A0A5D9C186_9SPHN|nr:PQQ-dependent dehydrogenase, methanol/ethanol family [Sphingomonas montanisoli]TZG24957.1 PQQ-dependent dehydrogenase, methanol/ethanol family [Sphingomonas montanisoli]